VYVERSARGAGVGGMALAHLCRLYTDLGFWKFVSPDLPVEHGKSGVASAYRLAGGWGYRRHGKTDGVWRDCVIVEKLLGDAAEATLERSASSSTGSFA
jgi:L-amino acid N-acyltransferase YncA